MASALREPLTPTAASTEAPASAERGRSFRLRLAPHVWLTVGAVWSWLLYQSASPFSPGVMLVLTPAFVLVAWLLYQGFRCELVLTRQDLAVFAGFVALQLVAHSATVFHSLGGDELYHAERASFLLAALRGWVEGLPPRSLDQARASMWNVFDPRHVPVVDLWRTISFPLLIIAALFAAALRSTRAGRRRWIAWAVLVPAAAALLIAAAQLARPPENHPPLRLLPLFVGTLVFGLNSFAFRVPGLLTMSALSFAVFRLLDARGEMRQSSIPWRLTVAGAVGFIPVVFYAAEAIEPSIYAFAACTSVLLLCWRFLDERDPEMLVLAGAVAGLGIAIRAPVAFVWLLIVPLVLVSRHRLQPLFLARVFFPAILCIPSLVTLRVLGHAAIAVPEGTALEKIARSLQSGVGPMSILNTATLPWVLATMLLLCVCLPRLRWYERAIYLLFLPAYALFHDIWSYLWPIGRYQAEYVAPFQALTLFFAGRLFASTARRVAYPMVAILAGITLEVTANLEWDTSYAQWPKMRITTSASFPYRDGLGFLKTREANGGFALLGGSPWYGDMALWLSGHTFSETRTWRENQQVVNAWIALPGPKGLADLVELCRGRGIRYLVVQAGTRRESQHRVGGLPATIALVESASLTSGSGISRVAQFGPEHGGWLEIYQVQ
jgi:hypothetical protein